MKRYHIIICLLAALVITSVSGLSYLQWTRSSPPSKNISPEKTTGIRPSPSDGSGTARIIGNNAVRASSQNTWTIVYTAGSSGISPGGGVVFHIPPFWGWTPPQYDFPERPGYVTVSCSDPSINLAADCSQRLRYVKVRTPVRKIDPGTTVTLVYGDTQNGTHPEAQSTADRYSESRERFYLKVDGDGDGFYAPIKEQPTIRILPGPARRFIVTAPSQVLTGRSFIVHVAPVDRMDNWVRYYDGPVTLTADSQCCSLKQIDSSKTGLFLFECICTKETPLRCTARAETPSLSGTSNIILCIKRLPERRLYWADLHGHSNMSDGTGTPEEYFDYARHVSRLDAASLTDHDAYGFDLLDEHNKIWKSIQKTAQRMNAPGSFITLPGYEWTSWTYGHKHVLFLSEPAPLYSSRDPRYETPEKLWKALAQSRAITISHHVGGGPIPADWDYYSRDLEPVVEICSIHGNSEYYGCPMCIYRPRQGCFVQDALERGYHLGFIGGGDTHNSHPGHGDPMSPIGGITGFYAERLSRNSLWNALKSRHTYATTGSRLILQVQIDSAMMGDTVSVQQATGNTIDITVDSGEIISDISVIRNNKTYRTVTPGKRQYFQSVSLPDDLSAGDFIYVRVTLKNSQMAWSSPIWFL